MSGFAVGFAARGTDHSHFRNPALEDQAYDRAHRLGQKLDVHIYKLTVRESVEDRILKVG